MKKIIIILLFALLLLPQTALSNNNFIYSINVGKNQDTGNIVLDVKSDYKTNIKEKIDENGRRYFDIKDASLKENFSVLYNNAPSVDGVIAQQIGGKVRIYIEGDENDSIVVNFNNVEPQAHPDKSVVYALLVFAVIMFGVLKLFNFKKSVKKTVVIQNINSKQVYKELMEKKTTPEDKSKMTLNSLRQRNANAYLSPRNQMMSNPLRQNVQPINSYKKQNVNSGVAM